jgi:hypothetical protein
MFVVKCLFDDLHRSIVSQSLKGGNFSATKRHRQGNT